MNWIAKLARTRTWREKLELLSLIRIYAAPVYFATLWADWAVESESFFGSSSKLQTGWELTRGIALVPLALIVLAAIAQYSLRLTPPGNLVARLARAFTGIASTGFHLFCGSMIFIVTAMATDGFFKLRLFSTTGQFELGFCLAISIASFYPLSSFVEGILRLTDAVRNWHNRRHSTASPEHVAIDAESPPLDEPRCEQVLLIHGTGSADEDDCGESWWQIGSEAETELRAKLPPGVSCHGPGTVFHWSGHNSEQARRNAGRDLYRHLLSLEESGQAYHLVAHSHGGSVVWHALQIATRRARELKHLRSWTTLGTPFLRYRAKQTSLFLLVPFFATLALLAWRTDFWRATTTTWELLVSRGYYPTTLLLAAIAAALTLMVVYNLRRIGRATWAWLSCRHDSVTDRQVMRAYGSRWLGLWSRSDEAITGLQGTLRLTRDGSVRETGDLSHPLHRLIRVFELPLRAVYDRLVRPIVDEFVWDRLMRKIQGNDLAEHQLKSVAATPEETFACRPADDLAERDILAWANAHCEKSGGLLRISLGLASSSDYKLAQVGEHLASILNGKELVHWSYYQLSFMMDRVVSHIRRHTLDARPEPPAVCESHAQPAAADVAHATTGTSGIRALAAFQFVVLLAIVLVAQMLDSYVLDQFTPERQIKEVVWRLPSISSFDARHTHALMVWAKEYARAGVTDFDLMNDAAHRRVATLDARVQLALVWASLENQRFSLATRLANEIKNPFYRLHAGVLVSGADPRAAELLEFRQQYAEDRSVAMAVGSQVAEAGTAEFLTRSAILFREINHEAKSKWHLFYDAEHQGRTLVERAVRHAQAWAGLPEAAAQMLHADADDGRMSRFSKLEFLIAMQPADDWFERAQAIAKELVQDESSSDFAQIPDLYARFGGLATAAAIVNSAEEPAADSRRLACRFELLEACRRYGLSPAGNDASSEDAKRDESNPETEPGAAAVLATVSVANTAIDDAAALAQDGRAAEAFELVEGNRDVNWLPRNYLKQKIIETLVRHGHHADAQRMTDAMLEEADNLDRDSHLDSDDARDLAVALIETRQFFLARDMIRHVSDVADRLRLHAAILSTYTGQLLAEGEQPSRHYVALYRAKDRELGLRRSSNVDFRLFGGSTW